MRSLNMSPAKQIVIEDGENNMNLATNMDTINSQANGLMMSQSCSNLSSQKKKGSLVPTQALNMFDPFHEFDLHINTATNNPVQSDIFKFKKFIRSSQRTQDGFYLANRVGKMNGSQQLGRQTPVMQ